MGEHLLNPQYRQAYRTPVPDPAPFDFHRTLPGYAPTPLRSLPPVAQRLGLGSIVLKDEHGRLGLPAYKILGASWATCRVLREWFRTPHASLHELRRSVAAEPPIWLVTATEGNHGRGVACAARWLGLEAEIHVPTGTALSRIEAIRGEGARVVIVPGTYDDAVASAARRAGERMLVIQDHGWEGYETIPAWIADGYETIFAEIDQQLPGSGHPGVDLVLVQIGVGTLASAVVRHFRAAGRSDYPRLIGVEPIGADCARRSIAAGHPVSFEVGAEASIMAGLNCGTPSTAAWPFLRDGVEAFVAVENERARQAMRWLAAEEIESGESGAAGLAGLIELMEGPHQAARQALGLGPQSRVLLLNTEGPTDPEAWARVVGKVL